MFDSDEDTTASADDLHSPFQESGIVMSGTDLAKILGVGSSSLSQSARSGWQCRGYDVSEWAVWENERIVSYDVPSTVVDRLTGPDAPDFPPVIPNPPQDVARREASFVPDPGTTPYASGRMQPPWVGPAEVYGAGFAPYGYTPPAPLGVEQVSAELRRVIKEMHRQAERRDEEFERTRQALREENGRLRDELRREQDEHTKAVREAERQLAKVRDEATEKRFELRERLLDAQTNARLAEGGVEESWIGRLVERHGEDFAGVLAGAITAFANRTSALAPPSGPSWPGHAVGTSPPTGLASGDLYDVPDEEPDDDIQAQAQVETAREIAGLLFDGQLDAVEAGLASLREELDPGEAAQLAGAVVQELSGTDPSALGARLRPVVALQIPLALTVPPAAAVQMARAYGVAGTEAEGAWLLGFVQALQEEAHPKQRSPRSKPKSESSSTPSTSDPS